jgi:hypothetical protein
VASITCVGGEKMDSEAASGARTRAGYRVRFQVA